MEIFKTAAENPWIIDIFIFCVGACAGSFLNVCICRIPAGESIVSPPSHCVCGKAIPPWLNIPILSWFMLRGRAKCCGAKISFRHPMVESLTALIFLLLWINFDLPVALAGMFFSSLMIFCAFVDIDTMELPDMATVGGMFAGVLVSAAVPALHGAEIDGAPFMASSAASVVSSITGAVVGAGILYLLRLFSGIVFKREAMGEGDVILSACIGSFCGWQGAVFAIFGGSVIGCVLLLPALLLARVFAGKGKRDVGIDNKPVDGAAESEGGEGGAAVPFGPWLAAGALLYFMYLHSLIDAYFGGVARVLLGV